MRNTSAIARGCAAALMAVMVMPAAIVPARAESPFALTVRVYNAAGFPAADIETALDAAEPILRDTAVDVTFRRCGMASVSAVPVDHCEDSLKPHEVVVRVIDAPKVSASLDPTAFGLTYVVAETNRGWLATVFADRVVTTAARIHMDAGTLAGLVLAHEVGHLLLGHGYHGEAGVMRADWPDQLLAGSVRQEWRFSPSEAALIQRNLIAR